MTYLLLNIDTRRVWITICVIGRILDIHLSRTSRSYIHITHIA